MPIFALRSAWRRLRGVQIVSFDLWVRITFSGHTFLGVCFLLSLQPLAMILPLFYSLQMPLLSVKTSYGDEVCGSNAGSSVTFEENRLLDIREAFHDFVQVFMLAILGQHLPMCLGPSRTFFT